VHDSKFGRRWQRWVNRVGFAISAECLFHPRLCCKTLIEATVEP
jgi:hypothetical protein